MPRRIRRRAPGKTTLTVSIDTDDVQDLKIISEEKGYTVSGLVRVIIKKELEEMAPKKSHALLVRFACDQLGRLKSAGGAVQIMTRTSYTGTHFGVMFHKGVGRVAGDNAVGVFREPPNGYYPQDGDTVVYKHGNAHTLAKFTKVEDENGEEVVELAPVVRQNTWNASGRKIMEQKQPGFFDGWEPMEETVEWWNGEVVGLLQKVHRLNAG